jgi:hypothetical protein
MKAHLIEIVTQPTLEVEFGEVLQTWSIGPVGPSLLGRFWPINSFGPIAAHGLADR